MNSMRWTLDHVRAMARTVADCAAMLQCDGVYGQSERLVAWRRDRRFCRWGSRFAQSTLTRRRDPGLASADAVTLFRFGDGCAVGARVGGGCVHLRPDVMHDGVASAHAGGVGLGDGDLMPLCGKLAESVRPHSRFDDDVATGGAGFGKSWRFQGRLQVHAVVGDVGDELGVGERLIRAAHDAEADVQIVLLHKTGNDRMERPFAGRQGVGLRLVEAETAAAVVEMETHAIDGDPGGPEAGDALDPRGNVAFTIDDAEIGRVARCWRMAGLDGAVRFIGVDQLGALRGVGFRDHALGGDLDDAGIGDVFEVGIGELHGFDFAMEFKGTERRGRLESFQNIEHRQRGEALAVGRNFVYAPAPVRGRDGCDPLGLESGEIVFGKEAAELAGFGEDGIGNFAIIKGAGAAVGQDAHGLGEIGIFVNLADGGDFAVRVENAGALRVFADEFGIPDAAHHFLDREAVASEPDGGGEQFVPGELAVFFVHRLPAADAAGDGDRVNAGRIHFLEALGLEGFNGHGARGGAAGIEAGNLAGFRIAVHDE